MAWVSNPLSTDDVTFTGRDGNRLAASAAGPTGGSPVVLLHGGGQTRHSWGTTLWSLGTQGWRAYSVDLRGHGDSDWAEDGDYSLDAFAGDVRAVASALGRPPALVGASLGGLSALLAVGSQPGGEAASGEAVGGGLASALVLVDVAPRMEEAGRQRVGRFMMEHVADGFATLEEVADAVAAYNPHRPRPDDLSGLKKNLRYRDGRWFWHWDPQFMMGLRGGPDETRASLAGAGVLDAAARAIDCPVLVVRGRQSDLLSEEGARELLELVGDGEMVDVAGAGHMVAGDRNDIFNDAVVGFLARRRDTGDHPGKPGERATR